MLLVVSRSDVRFGFDHPFLARRKSRAPKKKFAPPPCMLYIVSFLAQQRFCGSCSSAGIETSDFLLFTQ